jgi:hypothetical protein
VANVTKGQQAGTWQRKSGVQAKQGHPQGRQQQPAKNSTGISFLTQIFQQRDMVGIDRRRTLERKNGFLKDLITNSFRPLLSMTQRTKR